MPQEVEKRVEPVRVHLICDCGGEMAFNGHSTTMYPPSHDHTCVVCGAQERVVDKRYPFIKHKIIGEEFSMDLYFGG